MKLPPRGSAGATISYSFRFLWARDFAAVRDVLPFQGKFDTTVVPGMVIPTDLEASFSLRSRNSIAAVEAEHPAQTTIEPVGEKAGGIRVYRVRFSKLGENMLTIRYGDGLWTTLEFFVTEPIETLIRKRAAFLVSHQQHKDPGKWYVGVYSDWDQKNEVLRSPEDRDALSAWLTDANDDAANARQAFLASKNVFFRDQAEIASLELYISKYLWGGMQMTDAERYPYAIYGIPNWKANRASADPGRNGRAHVWRIYDYRTSSCSTTPLRKTWGTAARCARTPPSWPGIRSSARSRTAACSRATAAKSRSYRAMACASASTSHEAINAFT
jgi:hypothetical protein